MGGSSLYLRVNSSECREHHWCVFLPDGSSCSKALLQKWTRSWATSHSVGNPDVSGLGSESGRCIFPLKYKAQRVPGEVWRSLSIQQAQGNLNPLSPQKLYPPWSNENKCVGPICSQENAELFSPRWACLSLKSSHKVTEYLSQRQDIRIHLFIHSCVRHRLTLQPRLSSNALCSSLHSPPQSWYNWHTAVSASQFLKCETKFTW